MRTALRHLVRLPTRPFARAAAACALSAQTDGTSDALAKLLEQMHKLSAQVAGRDAALRDLAHHIMLYESGSATQNRSHNR